jgi:hypothetical protein
MEEGEEAAAILFMALVVSPFGCFGFVYGAAADRVRDRFFLLQDLEDWLSLSLLFFETRLIIVKQFFCRIFLAVEL